MAAVSTIPAPAVAIAEDALAVTLQPFNDGAPGPTPADLIAYLANIGITPIDADALRALAGPDGRITVTEDVVIARGRRPVPERPGQVRLLVEPDAASVTAAGT